MSDIFLIALAVTAAMGLLFGLAALLVVVQ